LISHKSASGLRDPISYWPVGLARYLLSDCLNDQAIKAWFTSTRGVYQNFS